MIYLYTGTPGSGKSNHVARSFYNYLKYNNGLVITNFPVKQKKMKRMKGTFIATDNQTLDPEWLAWISDWWFKSKKHRFKEGAIYLIIDEGQRLFDARGWNQPGREDWLDFFEQHRHFGYDVAIVTQHDRMIDKNLRVLAEYEYVHRKVANFGWKGKLLSLFSGGRLFCYVTIWRPMKEKVGSEFFKFKRKYANLYDTYYTFRKDTE